MKKIVNILKYHFPVHCINKLTGLLPDCEPVNKIRGNLMKPFFKRCGKNLQIASNVYFTHIDNIEIGDNVYIARNCWVGGYGGIKMSNNIMVGPGVIISSSNHIYKNNSIRFGDNNKKEINIGSEVWVGSNSSILGGATIPNNTIIGAGSVVNKKIKESKCLLAGSPAKFVKSLDT